MSTAKQLADFIWAIANLLRSDYKRSEYGRIILPFTILRRLDCVLISKRADVLAELRKLPADTPEQLKVAKLKQKSGLGYYNTYPQSLEELLVSDTNFLKQNLLKYAQEFSPGVKEIFEYFKFATEVEQLDKKGLLYLVLQKFCEVDLSNEVYPHHLMGDAYEELVRRFAEASNDEAGEHFTPREVIQLMTNLLFDAERLTKTGLILTVYDPACGTGGMLMASRETIKGYNQTAQVQLFGQELNDQTYGICKADVLLHDINADNIYPGNSISEDHTAGKRFDFMLCNPPFGVEWKKYQDAVKLEFENLGAGGRFGAGLPNINDGSLLFLQHMLSKMHPVDKDHPKGSRIAIVFNGSPLFTGGAGSGPSEIRRWILENDWLEAIIALPDQLFYNTGISTYIWVLSNAKEPARKGKIQLVDGAGYFAKMPRSVGNKRHYLTPEHIHALTNLYWQFQETPHSKIFPNEHFGYRRVTVDRPLRLNYGATPERMDALRTALEEQLDKARKKGGKNADANAMAQRYTELLALAAALPTDPTTDRDAFEAELDRIAGGLGLRLYAPERKLLMAHLSERDPHAAPVADDYGTPLADTDLRDYENIPLHEDVESYLAREVLPYAPDAYVDDPAGKIGYEIAFTREFYTYTPPRPIETIEAELAVLVQRLDSQLKTLIA